VIFLIANCATTQCPWDWKSDPYEGDTENRQIINGDGKEIKCDQGEFNDFTCFHKDNIIELKFNIDRLKIPRRSKNEMLELLKEKAP
jgi:hypothetical protein